eukprot:CAMPEP_0172690848 /NCGR_PEP_ID=MMETSP1074-20121228/24154_1 /TAXON_ID=2916 /ORGANISM="Ceratium fusus, Strain PA161109" /LENGTH=452 /DNA_ID=CAMNT_0013510847 /DNA_START=118 /DNA_END=1477 /DNA_ORIENTATION=-
MQMVLRFSVVGLGMMSIIYEAASQENCDDDGACKASSAIGDAEEASSSIALNLLSKKDVTEEIEIGPEDSSVIEGNSVQNGMKQKASVGDGLEKVAETSIVNTASKHCRTALFGSECYKRVVWVQRVGIMEQPEWYPNLLATSSFEKVQKELHNKKEGHCDAPCAEEMDPSVVSGPNPKPETPIKLDSEHPFPEICNSAVPTDTDAIPAAAEMAQQDPKQATSALWTLPESDLDRCFDALVAKKAVDPEDRKYRRNWCWVGLKEFGCHKNIADRLGWAEMQRLSLAAGVTSNATYHPIQKPQVCDKRVFGGMTDWSQSAWSRARSWFGQHVNVYVLSLASSTTRRTSIRTLLEKWGIPFQFVDGVDMRKPDALETAKREGLVPTNYNVEKAQAEAYKPSNGMGAEGSIMGTIGCASGHFRAQNRGLNDSKAITLVFEDDVAPEAASSQDYGA